MVPLHFNMPRKRKAEQQEKSPPQQQTSTSTNDTHTTSGGGSTKILVGISALVLIIGSLFLFPTGNEDNIQSRTNTLDTDVPEQPQKKRTAPKKQRTAEL